jgi:hypothetical protein
VIYFVQPRGRPFVKIGYARCVRLRVDDLQMGNPDELVVLGVIPGSPATEAAIQERFAHLHVRGELFHLTGEVRLFVRDKAEAYRPDVHDPHADDAPGRQGWVTSLAAVRPVRPDRGRRARVWVQRCSDRANLMLQWLDPDTGKRRSKSAGTRDRDEAEL